MYSRRCNDGCDTAPLQSYQDQLEKLLSTVEGTKASIDQNFAEVVTAIDLQNCNSSDSSNTELHGTNKEYCLNHRHFDASESLSSTMSDNFISFNGAIDTQRHVGPTATSLLYC
ncbi:predicted protein [Chaetoceros tenuissimus]|uniref:Uncharacterized protein n=1 Tax=Chaetoceros tenuissimus TaxID=426638 RepID=A0AAD3DC30_9STRA|nr:predicted protein [Chaetoceros tenuissimus]